VSRNPAAARADAVASAPAAVPADAPAPAPEPADPRDALAERPKVLLFFDFA
jgi:hypothetical protein